MIVTSRSSTNSSEFEELLTRTTTKLQLRTDANPQFYLDRTWGDFEKDVEEAMNSAAMGGSFDGSIKLLAGRDFPDIVAKDLYGVEVKSTKSQAWKTIGGTIMESTRARNLDRIYLVFGRLSTPVQFRWRKYEECLSDVKVTHSPRYQIDLDTEAGSSIFDKMGIPYEEIRATESPLPKILSYMRDIHRAKGEELWWLDDGLQEPPNTSISVRIWKNLSSEEQRYFKSASMAFFPEIFSSYGTKYSRLASWLVARHGVVNPSLRDSFTSSGQVTLKIGRKSYESIPKIFHTLQTNINSIIEEIQTTKLTDLAHYWGTEVSDETRLPTWIELVKEHAEKQLQGTGLDIADIVSSSGVSMNAK
jgi:hypothetical protein